MIKKKTTSDSCDCKCGKFDGNCGGFFYFLGFIGAAIYFISAATSFWTGVLGFLKATIWPVFLVHGLLKFLAG